MRIAILGTGFAGLSAAWHLLNLNAACEVVLFDPRGIGKGASGMAAGLMHPYVGEEGRRSFLASEGLEASIEMIDAVEAFLGESVSRRDGILRYVVSEEQNLVYLAHCNNFGDVKPQGDRSFLIESGMTIDCPRYLNGLWQMISAKGGILVQEEVSRLEDLKGFDQVIVAAGPGIAKFPELSSLKFSLLKGQVLTCRAQGDLKLPEKSSISKSYIALSSEKEVCYIGSTYERGLIDEDPNLALAKSLLFPKTASFFPEIDQMEVTDCKASLRVIRKGHYFPIVSKIKNGLFVLTAMGSRGLLYHALLGRLVASAILTDHSCPMIAFSLLCPNLKN